MVVHDEVREALEQRAAGGRAREHDHRPRAAAARQPAGRARDRGGRCASTARCRRRSRSSAARSAIGLDDDGARRARDRRGRRSAACAISRPSSRAAATARRRSPRPRIWPSAPASACSPPAGSAACTAARATSFDESADLGTLARLNICVVCAGVKSILDIPATLERLETLNVTVLGYRHGHVPGLLPDVVRACRCRGASTRRTRSRRCCERASSARRAPSSWPTRSTSNSTPSCTTAPLHEGLRAAAERGHRAART